MSITLGTIDGPVIVTRQEAIKAGLDTYFTGGPCKRGHVASRWVRNGDCSQCNKERASSWHFANRDSVCERLKAGYLDDKERRLRLSAEWKRANREAWIGHAIKWKKANPEKVRACNAKYLQEHLVEHRAKEAKRRALKFLSRAGHYTADDIRQIQKAQRFKCAYCKRGTKQRYHIDHVLPLCRGGSNHRNNLQILCPTCNLSKGAKHPIEFAQRLGRLL